MRPDIVHKVWCATKPMVAIEVVRLLDGVGFDWDLPLGKDTFGSGDSPVTVRSLLAHQAGLAEPSLAHTLLTVHSDRDALIRTRFRERGSSEPQYSEVGAWHALTCAAEEESNSSVRESIQSSLRTIGAPATLVVVSDEDLPSVSQNGGVYWSGGGGRCVPWLHDLTPYCALIDTDCHLGGYSNPVDLAQWIGLLATTIAGSPTKGFPPVAALQELFDPAATYSLGLVVDAVGTELIAPTKVPVIASIGAFGSCLAVARLDTGEAAALLVNGMPDDIAIFSEWRARKIAELLEIVE